MATKVSAYEKELYDEIKKTPEEFLPNLLQIVHIFRESVSLKSAEDSFREGWKEVVNSETHPVSKLWDNIDEGK